jgi:hypothetical protein
MTNTPAPTTSIWLRIFVTLCGIFVMFCVYKLYEEGEKRVLVQQNSPTVKMPIVGRERGAGTVKFPCKIFLRYHGKPYEIHTNSKYFRQTAKADSLTVHFDPEQNIVVRPGVKANEPYPLLALYLLLGLLLIACGVSRTGLQN